MRLHNYFLPNNYFSLRRLFLFKFSLFFQEALNDAEVMFDMLIIESGGSPFIRHFNKSNSITLRCHKMILILLRSCLIANAVIWKWDFVLLSYKLLFDVACLIMHDAWLKSHLKKMPSINNVISLTHKQHRVWMFNECIISFLQASIIIMTLWLNLCADEL